MPKRPWRDGRGKLGPCKRDRAKRDAGSKHTRLCCKRKETHGGVDGQRRVFRCVVGYMCEHVCVCVLVVG